MSAERSARAPRGAPNVVMVVLDDLGFAQLGCYGSNIATPTVDRLAANGLRYNRFHVTGLCTPTRAALLTGRNHHAVGMGFLADIPTTLPGYTAHIPRFVATLPSLLRDAGWSTMAVGKWHLTPSGERSSAGPFLRWPLGLGFERYYGFLRGDANHWAPELVRDNSYVQPPAGPADGYHLTEDLADEAIRMVVNQQESAPGKPFFLYFATGAMHSPHHVERSWADAYRDSFDAGWESWRDDVFAAQLASGVVPADTTLTPRPPWVPAWNELSTSERRLYSRMHEVFAGFLSHTDAQIGRLVAALERIGCLDNTLFLLMSDNGASAEGGVTGTANEHRFTARVRDELADNLDQLDDWGGKRGYPHYAWGWAWAGNTPFRLWKRYTWLGGTRVPLVAHWPDGIGRPGSVRGQFTHAIDVLPTVLDACGVAPPDPLDGASMRSTFDDGQAPDPRSTQYFELLGSRSIMVGGWKATTDHVSSGVLDEEQLMTGSRDVAGDRWSLFRMDTDFAEAHDVADAHPDVVRHLEQQWFAEAGRNNVLPLMDSLTERLDFLQSREYPVGHSAVLYPEGGPVSDDALPRLTSGGRVVAVTDVPTTVSNGVLFALGDWINGLAGYVVDGTYHAVVVVPGGTLHVRAERRLSPGMHEIGCVLRPAPGSVTLDAVVDGDVVATGSVGGSLPSSWQHGGTSITLGYDHGLPMSDDYWPPFPWTGTLHHILVEANDLPRPAGDDVRDALAAD